MIEMCAYCDTKMELLKPNADLATPPNNLQVGCNKCETWVCFGCAHEAASTMGIPRNCVCPHCGAELGLLGEVNELGQDFFGWGY